MDGEREQTDSVGPYGKSLLYLVAAPEGHWAKEPDVRVALTE